MATEITWTRRHGLHPSHLEQLGGPGWSADPATVVGQIGEGREYFVRCGEALLRVAVIAQNRRPALTTDPTESAENALLSLPEAPASSSTAQPGARTGRGAHPTGQAS